MPYWKKNPIYRLEENFYYFIEKTKAGTLIKKLESGTVKQTEALPSYMSVEQYSKKVAEDNPNFKGKIIIKYQDDHIGRGPGNAKWVYVYECENGQVTYIGNAVHKEADPDYLESGYNEVLWSILGKLVLDKGNVRVPRISLVEDMYFKSEPAILSYNLVNTRVEEMIQMDTIVHNSTERQEIHNNRVTLAQILQAVDIETKKVLKNVKGRTVFNINRYVQDMQIQMCDEGEEGNTKLQRRIEVSGIIRDIIEETEEPIVMETIIGKVLERCSEKISEERIRRYIIESPVNLSGRIQEINYYMQEQKLNYDNLQTGILHTALLDAITNNLDRHLSNWAIVREKTTGRCSLAVFDNTLSFINMSSSKPFSINGEWAESSIHVQEGKKCTSQKEICEYIARNYPQELADFIDIMKEKMPKYAEEIGMPIVIDEEYKILTDVGKANCGSYRKPVLDDKVIAGLKSKIKMLEKILSKSIDKQLEELSEKYVTASEDKKMEVMKKFHNIKSVHERINQQENNISNGR